MSNIRSLCRNKHHLEQKGTYVKVYSNFSPYTGNTAIFNWKTFILKDTKLYFG